MGPTFALSVHADYRCRSTGMCCSSGWEIPVAPDAEKALHAALTGGALHPPRPGSGPLLRPVDGLPDGALSVLGQDSRGRCLFLETDGVPLCSVHRQLGADALPVSCRQFPRVALETPRGVFITLSHYCPTAARALLRQDIALTIVESPPAFPGSVAYEGLDAREALPPFLRPGVLMCWESYGLFERHAVATFARDDLSAEAALASIATLAERLRTWSPSAGPFLDFARRSVDRAASVPLPARPDLVDDWPAVSALRGLVASCVPAHVRTRTVLDGEEEAWRNLALPSWSAWGPVVRRYLAAKVFASWCALQGGGLRTAVHFVRAAHAVLMSEAAAVCKHAGRPLDAELWVEALRQADLLIVHLVSPEMLARRLSDVELAPSR